MIRWALSVGKSNVPAQVLRRVNICMLPERGLLAVACKTSDPGLGSHRLFRLVLETLPNRTFSGHVFSRHEPHHVPHLS